MKKDYVSPALCILNIAPVVSLMTMSCSMPETYREELIIEEYDGDGTDLLSRRRYSLWDDDEDVE